jgi:putative endonuclease
MNTKYKKKKGEEWETLVAEYYKQQWYILIERNYTIPWWELDLIFQKNDILTFVEVKVVDHINDLQNYVTDKKLWHVKHTITYYLLTHPTDQEYTLDVVFVRDNSILEVYKNVTNS